MPPSPAHINLVLAWALIAFGFGGGFVFGLFFHRDDWMGGYTSFRRRLYRLAHIASLALAMINILFCLTVQHLPYPNRSIDIASWGFVIGAISMPISCMIMAHKIAARAIFLIPVISLIGAAVITLLEVAK
jgi:hypothetical protein